MVKGISSSIEVHSESQEAVDCDRCAREIRTPFIANSLAKIGLFGSTSGDNCDITVAPLRLETITVHSGDVIDAIAFTYRDRANQVHTAGPWGGSGGGLHEIQLGPLEFVTEIHGTYGPYTYGPHGRVEGITNLTFITNRGSYGPYGVGKLDTENKFSVPVQTMAASLVSSPTPASTT
ncbi:hypothetical protein PR202_ga30072 [Eleusine coracana subsp. coracana]|uniref:Jacalin-type lectin domain-containing protein n=1 Tax=Eleusine coracana subsp. coracana TaxID=191504 RepID=A0AAV5DNE5_ELECO|nr:hypothetical protein PR202_ga30072 [Eleusine coracana subsp. coracana]